MITSRVEFQIGDRVRKRTTGILGRIADGPILNGGDWWVRWDRAMGKWPEYCEDLEKLSAEDEGYDA